MREKCLLGSRVVSSVPVISVRGDLDDTRAFDLGAFVRTSVAQGYRTLIADFTEVDRIGVVGLGAVLDMCSAAARGGVIVQAVLSPHIDLLIVAKLATCFGFEIYESLQAALLALEEDQREVIHVVACA